MASKRKCSQLWNHFEQTEPKKAKCNYCSRQLAISTTSIGGLRKHMKACHPTIDIELNRQEHVLEESTQQPQLEQPLESLTTAVDSIAVPGPSRLEVPIRKQVSQTMLNYVVTKKPLPPNRTKELDEQLVKFIAKGYHAFRIVEEPEFRKLIAILNPGYTLPTRKTVSQTLIPKAYAKLLEIAKSKIVNAEAVCITTDGWTSITHDGYIAVTAHYIDQHTDSLCSIMIGIVQFEEQHTAANLSTFLDTIFREWNISNKIGVIVSDNAANILSAVRVGGWRSIGCFAHTINLIVKSGLKSINNTTEKIKQIVEYFHRSPPGAKKFKETQQQMNKEPIKLKQDVITRWNSTYEMFERVSRVKDAVIATLALVRSDLMISQEDWLIIEKTLPILSIFYEVTKEVSSENYVSASKYIVFCKLINKTLGKVILDNTTPPQVQELLRVLKEQMKQRLSDTIERNILLSEATILDPRFKRSGFSDINSFEKAATILKNKIGNITVVAETNVPEPEIPCASKKERSIWEEFDTEVSTLNPINPRAAGIVEFDKYMQEPLLNRHENPLLWWKQRKAVYPRLYNYMLKRLNITATSVPCERVFSKAGLTLNERRTRLKTKKLSQLMFISCN